MRKTISVLNFIKTGQFGDVYLGQTMADVKNILSKPDDVTEIMEDTFIWRYSAFELHFRGDSLTLLWCDNLDYMYSPNKKQFKLDRWVLDKYKEGTDLRNFIKEIEKEQVVYNLEGVFFSEELGSALPDSVIMNINNTDVVIYFENEEEQASDIYEYKLIAIGSSQFKQRYKVRPI